MLSNISHILKDNLSKYRIGELLIHKGHISEQQLVEALSESRKTGEKIGKTLVSLGYISSFQLYRKIVMQWQLRISAFAILMFVQLISPITAYAAGSEQSFGNEYKIAYQMNNSNSAQKVQQPEIFGYKEFKSEDIASFTKWTGAMSRYDHQIDEISTPSSELIAWKEKLQELKGKTATEQINEINDYINKNRYIEDKDNYSKSDYWATPIEFLSKGGDCEDFAIAKYTSLKALGFDPDQMRITIVKDTEKNIHHAVLIVNSGGNSFVLDNQSRNVEATTQVTKYEPIFSINSKNWWLHEA